MIRFVFILLLTTVISRAATHTAASPNRADVLTAYNACAHGDTLSIPAGTSTPWTDQIIIAKNITIRGAGAGVTTLVKGNPQQDWHGYKPIFYVTASGVWRIRDLSFDGQWTGGGKGIVVAGGYGRIDHCYFWRCYDRAIQTFAPIGLIDHVVDVDSWALAGHYADQYSAWNRPLWIGTTNAWVIEDSYITRTGAYYAPVVDDGGWGARYTFRNNIVSNVGLSNFDYALDAHGNQGKPFGDPSTSIAGTVFLESYDNIFSMGTANRGMILRGGTQIHYNNTLKATGGNMVTFTSVFVLSEEDGYRYGSPIRTAWPGYQQITNSYFWNNTFNGADGVPRLEFPGTTPCLDPNGCGAPWPSDGIFMQELRDYWLTMPSTNFYLPLGYPHPRIVLENDPPIPPSFNLTSPANGATSVSIQPTVTWSDTSTETAYRLLISTDLFFSTRQVDQALAANATSYPVPAGRLAVSTKYYWKVIATNSNGVNTSANAPWSFTTGSGVTVPGSFQFSSATYSVDENQPSILIAVNRVGGTDGAVGVSFGTTPGTAQPGVNYSTTSGSLSWANGVGGAKTFAVPILNDGIYTSSLSFTVTLSSATGGASLGSPSSATVTVNNVNPPPGPPLMPGLSFHAYEGFITAPGATNAAGEFRQTVETSNPADGGRVAWQVTIPETRLWRVKSTVRAPTTANNSFFIDFDNDPPASPTAIWSIVPLTAATGTESRYVDWLGNGTSSSQFPTNSWALSAGVHTLYIRGREANTFLDLVTIEAVPVPGTIQFSAAVYSVNEDGGTLTVTARRINGSDGAVGVSYSTTNGTAVAGVNFTAASGTLSWADSETAEKTFAVTILDDGIYTDDTTFTVGLSSLTGGAVPGDPQVATVTIHNTNPPPTPEPGLIQFSTSAQSVLEDAGFSSVVVRRAQGSDGAVGISYATQDITAVEGVNYTGMSGTLSWLDTDSADKSFNVPIINDGVYGPDLTFRVILHTITGGADIGVPSTNVVTIQNINPPPTPPPTQSVRWEVPGGSAEEGTSISFSVLRLSGTDGTIMVDYATSDGTAKAGINYGAAVGTIVFGPGDTIATIVINLPDNDSYEANKWFLLTLSNPLNCTIQLPSETLAVITENDRAPTSGPVSIRSGRFHRLIIGNQ